MEVIKVILEVILYGFVAVTYIAIAYHVFNLNVSRKNKAYRIAQLTFVTAIIVGVVAFAFTPQSPDRWIRIPW